MNKFWGIGIAVVILLMAFLACWGFREVNPTDEELIEFYCDRNGCELVEFRGLDELNGETSLSYVVINSNGCRRCGEVQRDWLLRTYKSYH